jgi:hypothetical protein
MRIYIERNDSTYDEGTMLRIVLIYLFASFCSIAGCADSNIDEPSTSDKPLFAANVSSDKYSIFDGSGFKRSDILRVIERSCFPDGDLECDRILDWAHQKAVEEFDFTALSLVHMSACAGRSSLTDETDRWEVCTRAQLIKRFRLFDILEVPQYVNSLSIACSNMNHAACFNLGQSLLKLGNEVADPRFHFDGAIVAFETACRFGIKDGCGNGLIVLRENFPNHEGMQSFAELACDQGPEFCFSQGYYLSKRSDQGNSKDAIRYWYGRGCEQKHSDSCYNLALLYSREQSRETSDKYTEYMIMSCDYGDLGACSLAAQKIWSTNSMTPPDLALASSLFGKRCVKSEKRDEKENWCAKQAIVYTHKSNGNTRDINAVDWQVAMSKLNDACFLHRAGEACRIYFSVVRDGFPEPNSRTVALERISALCIDDERLCQFKD